ncbi:hypothetical protein RHSIM_Rhsim06G0103600 [Rhododendron simsii]|uniref:Uncharacterized protein n=1 Tax=Rhododendron simsii TaxID=118357 RepID=A0A834GV17_RHOSS|nr:hypothetical protein RHSIM_Rhsim06G0103600 [Rhododendron simsii]
MKTEYREKEQQPCCYFHQEQVVIGVCPICLNERLVILAAKQSGEDSSYRSRNQSAKQRIRFRPSSIITLPKIFALGSLLKSHEHKPFDYSCSDASTSPEDSFISIKFEENGVPSWEKSKLVSNASLDYCNIPRSRSKGKDTTNSTVVELPKPRGRSLRWRKRIGHLFQLSRWKKPTNGSGVCHVGSSKVVEGVKVRSTGWIRSLTKRRRSGMK